MMICSSRNLANVVCGFPQVVDRVTAAQERLDFGEAGRAMYDFFWSQFADWYIEAAKTRLYGGDAAVARSTRAVRPAGSAPLRLSLQHACEQFYSHSSKPPTVVLDHVAIVHLTSSMCYGLSACLAALSRVIVMHGLQGW